MNLWHRYEGWNRIGSESLLYFLITSLTWSVDKIFIAFFLPLKLNNVPSIWSFNILARLLLPASDTPEININSGGIVPLNVLNFYSRLNFANDVLKYGDVNILILFDSRYSNYAVFKQFIINLSLFSFCLLNLISL